MKNSNENNTLSIVGFILSFIIPVVGLILSIIGLSKSKELNNKGKGLSIAGIIISVLLFIFQFLVLLLLISIGTVSSTLDTAKNNANKLMCEKAYDCELDSTGNYSCKYLNNDGTIEKITCENNNYLTKEEIVGYYEPYDLKVNGVSESLENYLGHNDVKSYILFNDDNTFKDYLTIYANEDEITGKYTINKNIINITLNTNASIKIEAEKENNTILLKMDIDESTVLYLRKTSISSEQTKIGKVIEKPNGRFGYYKLSLENINNNDNIIYTLNNDYKVELKIIDKEFKSFEMKINGKEFIIDDALYEDYIQFYLMDTILIYINTGVTDIRSETVYIIEKNGTFNEIYELENINGMVPEEISINNNIIEIKGTRFSHGPSIIYNNSMDDANPCDKKTWGKYGITESTIVAATYIYKYENNTINLVPSISNKISLKDELEKGLCNY